MSTAAQMNPPRPYGGGLLGQLQEIVRHRDLLMLLTRKELRVRYRGTVLGFAWSLLNPLLFMAVYSTVFTVIARSQMERYPVFVFSGILPWNALQASITGPTTSIIGHSNLVKRVKFPVELLPISAALTNMINLVLGLSVMVIVAVVWPPPSMVGLSIVTLPLLLALQTVLCVGIALGVSALNVYFRDLEYLLQVGTMLLFFGSPILYSLSMIPNRTGASKTHLVQQFNPVYWLMSGYQAIWYWHTWPNWRYTALFAVFSFAVLALGAWIFRRASRRFAEEV